MVDVVDVVRPGTELEEEELLEVVTVCVGAGAGAGAGAGKSGNAENAGGKDE